MKKTKKHPPVSIPAVFAARGVANMALKGITNESKLAIAVEVAFKLTQLRHYLDESAKAMASAADDLDPKRAKRLRRNARILRAFFNIYNDRWEDKDRSELVGGIEHAERIPGHR